jgi:hypothetical protein
LFRLTGSRVSSSLNQQHTASFRIRVNLLVPTLTQFASRIFS